MADNTTISVTANMADHSQQNCPIMRLPVELRLRIYNFAFEDIIDEIVADAANKKRMYQEADEMWPSLSVSKADHPIFVGVLSLLHVSRELRRESLDALRTPTRAFKKTCSVQSKTTLEARRIPVRDEHGNLRYSRDFLRIRRLLHLEHSESQHRLERIELICDAISLIGKFARVTLQRERRRSKQRRR